MSRIELAPEVGSDLERILEHLVGQQVEEIDVVFVLAVRGQKAGYTRP